MFRSFVLVALLLTAVLFVSVVLPQMTYASALAPQDAPMVVSAQGGDVPVPGGVLPAILQAGLIVLIAQGIKSLGKVWGWDLSGRSAAIAYIIVGIIVYGGGYALAALPPDAQKQVTDFLAFVATLLVGSGLYSMTSAFRADVK